MLERIEAAWSLIASKDFVLFVRTNKDEGGYFYDGNVKECKNLLEVGHYDFLRNETD